MQRFHVIFIVAAMSTPSLPAAGDESSDANASTERVASVANSAPDIDSPGASSTTSAGACAAGAGDCCNDNGTPGCDDVACCKAVCAQDPFCCNSTWDNHCVSVAEDLCPTVCSTNPACPSAGNCCASHGGTGCDNAFCCDLVCANTPSCCEAVWSQTCVSLAEILCDDLCAAPFVCPGHGGCCILNGNGSPGCEDSCCCEAVCAEMPTCCTIEWTSECSALAQAACAGKCGPPVKGCPGEGGDCFVNNGSPGCDDEFCCSLVCTADPKCCDPSFGWDTICVGLAEELCNCGGNPSCPGKGSCCAAHGTPGCDDPSCCEKVCTDDPACCNPDVGWDEICAESAADICPSACACQDGEIFECDQPSVPFLDARQPHPVDSTKPMQGVSSLRIFAPRNAQFTQCWELCETSQNHSLHADVGPNAIVTVTNPQTLTYDITLAQPLTPGEITTITYRSATGLTKRTCTYVYLPGDVNGDGTSAPSDILGVIDCLNGVATFDCGITRTDVDRSEEAGPPDILRVIDLLNGASAFEVWLDATVTDTGACP